MRKEFKISSCLVLGFSSTCGLENGYTLKIFFPPNMDDYNLETEIINLLNGG